MPEKFEVVGSNALAVVPENTEQTLGSETTAIVQVAQATTITNQEGYEAAAETLKSVKRLQKKVEEYWEPLRAAAWKTYKNIQAKMKQMTEPLNKAEETLKGAMSGYTDELEKKWKAMEEAMRLKSQMEADRMMEEAIVAEATGDTAGAVAAMEEAEVMEQIAAAGKVIASAPKAAGVSQSKTWKIISIDPDKVPIKALGVEIRPVDRAAVMRLIKASKGTIQIPGIQYEESVQISVRA